MKTTRKVNGIDVANKSELRRRRGDKEEVVVQ
jgi:hypothetical protein